MRRQLETPIVIAVSGLLAAGFVVPQDQAIGADAIEGLAAFGLLVWLQRSLLRRLATRS